MQLVTISSQRQITLPVDMLNQLGVDKKDKLFLTVEGERMIAKPQKGSVVDRLAGSLNRLVSKSRRKIPTHKAIEIARDIAAKEIANE
ncbi:MAG: Transcriptional regulator, AbrB family [Candidatus Beckwithbacteria bacterium GW2011_GWA2_43_10]|uniref:Transcriptional regulator, AbrB family n=1 Tax=Candidatus Beckwithbacteria bacterium GW2011_GWA2_43_10 TaxID=1618369 RepID=A0A0G1C4K8_9BACT|nr:MAG: Transcriptional regulator, AbrB family [Candidatus Beckwithbacteria bacterium GW2011_GWA2_43_10]